MEWLPRKKILVPYDFSDESYAAIKLALSMVESPEHVEVVHVLPEISVTEPGVIWQSVDDESRRQHAADAAKTHLSQLGDVSTSIRIGDAGREITDFANEVKADLIIVPSHGRTGMKRLFLGSVAERVIRLAHCPVLVLRN